jgi:hypothetical protein
MKRQPIDPTLLALATKEGDACAVVKEPAPPNACASDDLNAGESA